MRKLLFLFLFIGMQLAYTQTPTYRWVTGSTEFRQGPNTLTTEPGPRQGAVSFTDSLGNLWFHGGEGHDLNQESGYFNDLWEYDRGANSWAWQSGQITVERSAPDYNNSLSFDGIDDKIVLNENPIESYQDIAFTVELWFKTTEDGHIISWSPVDENENFRGWSIVIEEGALYLNLRGYYSGPFTNEDVRDGNWHHIAFTNSSSTTFQNRVTNYYFDGELTESSSQSFFGMNENGDHKIHIGSINGRFNTEFFEGQIDEVRFWDIARNEGEIQSFRKVEIAGDEEGLVAYYNFNQGIADFIGNSESELVDSGPNENQGEIGDIFREGIFIGQMNTLRVWSRYMSVQDIAAVRDSVLVGNEEYLEMSYDFQDGTPNSDNTLLDSLDDISDGDRKGSINNFNLDGDNSNIILQNAPHIRKIYQTPVEGGTLVSGDMNQDDYEDLVSSNNDAISILLNNQEGGFEDNSSFDSPSTIKEIELGNINDDDFLDVVVVGFDSEEDDFIRIFQGDGAGGVLSTIDIDPGDGTKPEDVKVADFNGDSFDDIVVTLWAVDKMRIYFSDGAGGFTMVEYNAGQVDTFFGNEDYLTVADYNNDGFPDIAARGYFESNQVRFNVFLNDGTGALDSISSTQSEFTQQMLPADINNDGNMDVVYFYQGIGYFLGNGDGTFQPGISVNTEDPIVQFSLADVNNDSNVDVIYNLNRTSMVLLGDGNAGFEEYQAINSSGYPSSLNVADYNNNGFFDFSFLEYSQVEVITGFGDGFKNPTETSVLDFDGIDDFIEIPNLRPFDDNFTIEGWIKTEDNGPIFSFVPEAEDYVWGDSGSGAFSLAIKEGKLTFLAEGIDEFSNQDILLADGNWHHIAATFINNAGSNDLIQLTVDNNHVASDEPFDFFDQIAFSDLNYASRLGSATSDFKSTLGSTGQNVSSNWTQGVEFPNTLNGRAYHNSWVDSEGYFYIFGGFNAEGDHNSIEKYNPDSKKWEIVNGEGFTYDGGYYGAPLVSDPLNLPASRWKASSAQDTLGNIWIYGGFSGASTAENWRNDLWYYNQSINEWTWTHGSDTIGTRPIYGTQLVADEMNTPGAREYSSMWVDDENNLWLFGGEGFLDDEAIVHFNDLWKFDISVNQWIWISGGNQGNEPGVYGTQGITNSNNYPGARESAVARKDDNGIVWLFGGFGYDKFGASIKQLNDLWSYDQESDSWTWHSGSDFGNSTGSYIKKGISANTYVPGARDASASWIDDENNFWIYGGFKATQFKTGRYNDFWKYDQSSNEWTWFSGFNSTTGLDQVGTYGNVGVASDPHPSARHGASTWQDSEGNFWMQGGALIGSSGSGLFNDLWKYEEATNKWEYFGGDTDLSLNDGDYGAKGVANSSNEPKSRWHAASWVGDDDRLWFFGGLNQNQVTNSISWLNDLWVYDPEQRVYTWMAGSSEIDGEAVYGNKGESSAAHVPGARGSSTSWVDGEGMFWLFGGYESFEYNNDLWKFDPNTLEWTWVSGNNFQNTPGVYGELGVEAETNEIGSRRYLNSWYGDDGMVYLFGGQGVDSEGILGDLNDMWRYNPETNLWTWLSGSTTSYDNGNFGELGVASPNNLPRPRNGYLNWKDDSGNLWIFGGRSSTDLDFKILNDLWKYEIESNMWTWMGGDSTAILNDIENYGVQEQFSESNKIPSRERTQGFKGKDKSFWLFGGRYGQSFNDLWQIKFTPGMPKVENPYIIKQSEISFIYDEPWAKQYQIQLSEASDFSTVLLDVTTETDETNITSLSPGTYYYYRVNATNDVGESGFGSEIEILTLPETPSFFTGAVVSDLRSDGARVNWEEIGGVYDGFYLDISLDSTFNSTQANQMVTLTVHPDSLTRTFGNLKPGTNYHARLRSFNATGESPNSEPISFLTTPRKPNIISSTVLTDITQSTANLSWVAVPEILEGYQVVVSTDSTYQDSDAFLDGYEFASVEKVLTQLRIQGMEPGTQYYIYVFAFNASGFSNPSDRIPLLTLPASPLFNLDSSIDSVAQNAARISWVSSPEIFDGYKLEVSTDFNFSNSSLMLEGYGRNGIPKNLSKVETQELIENLQSGGTYFARIRSYNATGDSPNSNTLIINTVSLAPTFNSTNNVTQNSASLSWSSPQGADLYLLDINSSEDFSPESIILNEFPTAVPFQILENLNSGQRYYARIQSRNDSGDSGDMDPENFGLANFITIPATPVLNDPDLFTQTSITLSWDAVLGASAYEVDVSDNFFQTFLVGYSSLEIAENQIVIENLDPGEEYQFRVRAKNGSGKSPNIGNFNLKTIPGTPTARDATNVSTSVFTTNWDAVSGADFYQLEVSSDDFSTFYYNETVSSPNPIQISDLTPGITYKYRVKSGNASGESPYSNEVSVIAQNNAQSLVISSIDHVEEFTQNQTEAIVTVNLSGGLGTSIVTYRHKSITQSPSQWSEYEEAIEVSATKFEFTITAAMLDDIGVVFDVKANDGVTFTELLDNTIRKGFSVNDEETLPNLSFNDWQMISIPFELDRPDVMDVFDELAELTYKKKWRLMNYRNGEYFDVNNGQIDLGVGYWFYSKNAVEINVGAGKTNSAIPFIMSLVQGWNQIGNPYNTTINWDNILSDNGVSTIVEDLLTYDVRGKEFRTNNSLNAYQGAFVWSDAALDLQVSPVDGDNGSRIANKDEFKQENGSWKLPLMLNTGGTSKEVAALGMHTNADNEKDQYDKMTLPRFNDYLEMYTKHQEYFYPYFSTDIVPVGGAHIWNLNIASNYIEGQVQLEWESSLLPSNGNVWLVDEEKGKVISMNAQESYSVSLDKIHQVSVHYSTDPGYTVLPSKLLLGDVYPNPMSTNTTVPLILPERGSPYDVNLVLIDLQGKEVMEVMTGSFEAGIYELNLNVENEAIKSGVYILQLNFKDPSLSSQKKKIIKK